MFRKKKDNKKEKYSINEQNSKLYEEEEIPNLFSSDRKTVRTLCSPDGVNPNPLGYMIINDGSKDIYICTMYIDKMPRRATFAETFQELQDYPHTTSNIYISPLLVSEASKMLDKRVVELDSELLAAERETDRNRYRKIGKKMSNTEAWADSIEGGENVMYRVAMTFSIWAESLDELNDLCSGIHDIAKEKRIDLVSAYSVQPEAYLSAAPLNYVEKWKVGLLSDRVFKYHIMDRYSLSTIFNHTKSHFSHKNGILAGHNMATGQPVLVDPYDSGHDGYNIVVTGITGVGKSASLKMWTSRLMEIFDYKLAVVDYDSPNGMEGEYVTTVAVHGGVVYQIKNGSENKLNPFELEEELIYNTKTGSEERALFVQDKVSDCTYILLSMIKAGKENIEFDTDTFLSAIVANCVFELYAEREIIEGKPDSLYQTNVKTDGDNIFTSGRKKKELPTISDFYIKLLKKRKENTDEFYEKAYALALAGMEPFIQEVIYTEQSVTIINRLEYEQLPVDTNGRKVKMINGIDEIVYRKVGIKTYFDGQSTVPVTKDTRCIDIDISQLPKNDRVIAQQIACSFINEFFVKKNSNNPNRIQKCMFLVDEFHNSFDNLETRKYMESLYRQARKRYVSMVTATQALADYEKYEETKAIVKNSAMKILFKQDIMDSAYIRNVTKLTETQISQVTQLGGTIGLGGSAEKKRKGECCLIDNNDNVVFVKVDYLTRTEAKICETDPAEIAKMMAVPVRRGMVG